MPPAVDEVPTASRCQAMMLAHPSTTHHPPPTTQQPVGWLFKDGHTCLFGIFTVCLLTFHSFNCLSALPHPSVPFTWKIYDTNFTCFAFCEAS